MVLIETAPLGPIWSALDGYALTALDTDPAENLTLMLANLSAVGLTLVTVVPVRFAVDRPGYLVVTYDHSKDHRALADEAES